MGKFTHLHNSNRFTIYSIRPAFELFMKRTTRLNHALLRLYEHFGEGEMPQGTKTSNGLVYSFI